ncbi:MAG TPA: T9SS type A sorting domain-containing protein, partial [Parafilimonas sp.]
QAHTYTAYDNSPLNGKNFYRIKQYDADGKWNESETKVISMQVLKTLLTVFPNPAKENINFTLSNYKGNVTATLSDVKGRVIHTEIITVNESNTYKLNLKNMPAPGIYILQLKGDNLSANSNVIIQ